MIGIADSISLHDILKQDGSIDVSEILERGIVLKTKVILEGKTAQIEIVRKSIADIDVFFLLLERSHVLLERERINGNLNIAAGDMRRQLTGKKMSVRPGNVHINVVVDHKRPQCLLPPVHLLDFIEERIGFTRFRTMLVDIALQSLRIGNMGELRRLEVHGYDG